MKYVLVILVFVALILYMYYYNTECFTNNNTSPYIIDIVAGANHSVFLTKHGKISTCGKNINGRLGTGNNASVVTPISLDNSIHIKKLFSGNVNTFFLTQNGLLYATGENSKGQLGIGNLDNQFSPVSIPFFKSMQIKKVTAGWYHTIFLTTTGDVYVCGDNTYGQLGNGTNVATNIPIKLDLKCSDIAAGQGHSVFLTTDNKVYTAGWNWYGQLGNNTKGNSNKPFLINTDNNIIHKVYAGMSYTLLLNSSGKVFGCGDNTNGQIGLSRDIVNQRSFKQIQEVNEITDISTGQSHTFFMTNKNDMYAVGLNEKGQLGIGHNNTIYKPEKVAFFNKNIWKIAAGANHSLFITNDGSVYATGDNTMGGQLGIKTITDTNIPQLCDIDIRKANEEVLYEKEIVGHN